MRKSCPNRGSCSAKALRGSVPFTQMGKDSWKSMDFYFGHTALRCAFRTSGDGDQETGEIWVKIGIRENGALGADAVGETKDRLQGGDEEQPGA